MNQNIPAVSASLPAVRSQLMVPIHLPNSQFVSLSKDLESFLDFVITAKGRATFYNSKEEQEAAELEAHKKMFLYDRLLYGAVLALPGVMDRSRQQGILRLLSDKHSGGMLQTTKKHHAEMERNLLEYLCDGITVPRQLRTFVMAGQARINNMRTRKLILRHLLHTGAVGSLEMRAVRYRRKYGAILRHVWGQKLSGVIRSILQRPYQEWEPDETKLIRENVYRYIPGFPSPGIESRLAIAYALGSSVPYVTENPDAPIIAAVRKARNDLSKGERLPPEVLEGIRGQFHKEVKSGEVLELAKDQMSSKQRINVQAQAKREGVEVAFDPLKHDAVKLYIYAYEMGMTAEIRKALDKKAEDVAKTLPFHYENVGIIVDASASMYGHKTQKLHPIAVALAVEDVLRAASNLSTVHYVGGNGQGALIQPKGDTNLALSLVGLLEHEPDAVFVITDGYENAPAGRFGDTLERVRDMGIDTPVIQVSPVTGAESEGIRVLGGVSAAIPVVSPEALVSSALKLFINTDIKKAITMILTSTIKEHRLGDLGWFE
ncbi:hypothetical protein LCGC14_0231490 [marine sediment metagenome]|uniref:VWFA domain-containing protein n=1 Tax=marine sediment metagenome TaxID=412755 RepID=A0A0F9WUK7_9ZZZZ